MYPKTFAGWYHWLRSYAMSHKGTIIMGWNKRGEEGVRFWDVETGKRLTQHEGVRRARMEGVQLRHDLSEEEKEIENDEKKVGGKD